jgi:hypothetical protein
MLARDLVGVFGPGEGPGVVVPGVDEGADGVLSWRTEVKEPRRMACRVMTEKKQRRG